MSSCYLSAGTVQPVRWHFPGRGGYLLRVMSGLSASPRPHTTRLVRPPRCPLRPQCTAADYSPYLGCRIFGASVKGLSLVLPQSDDILYGDKGRGDRWLLAGGGGRHRVLGGWVAAPWPVCWLPPCLSCWIQRCTTPHLSARFPNKCHTPDGLKLRSNNVRTPCT